MPNVTMYVKDDDMQVLEDAKKTLMYRDSFSLLVVRLLRDYLASTKGKTLNA